MRSFTFRGGVHPPHRKADSINETLKTAALPEEVVVPLQQHIGALCSAVVKKGDEVEEGQLIGESESFISALVHSSVAGKVKKIEKRFHPTLGPQPAVVIAVNSEARSAHKEFPQRKDPTPEEIIEIVKSSGIVGMGGAAFPTHVKLSVPEGKNIETLIINGAECEPYLTCDQALMMRKTKEIIEGIKLLVKVLRPEKVFIAIEDNKKAASFAFEKFLKKEKTWFNELVELAILKTKYPQGGEKQLIKAIAKKEVPPGGLPLDIGFLVQNVGTVYAIYEAVYCNKPLIERVVTVAGDCVAAPRNCRVRIGMTAQDLIDSKAIELKKEPDKVIFGGPMMGVGQPTTDVPVIKSTSGILFLSDSVAGKKEETACIKCAKCVDVCPVNLLPTNIMKNVKFKMWDKVEQFNISDCMECGSCGYACPSRIPLVHYIKEGKSILSRRGR